MKNVRNVKETNKIVLFMLFLSVMMLGLLNLSSQQAGAAQVTASVANVRMQPAGDAEIAGTLLQNTEVKVLQWSGEWAEIQSGSVQGWMHKSVLSAKPTDYVAVNEDSVNLRSGPGTDYPITGYAVKGDRLVLLDGSGEWYTVQTAEGKTAYILGSLTKPAGTQSEGNAQTVLPQKQPEKQYVEIIEASVHLRQGPGTTFESIGYAVWGDRFLLLGQENGWYAVKTAQGEKAYVLAELAELTEKLPEIPDSKPAVTPSKPSKPSKLPASGNEESAPSVFLNGNPLTFDDVEPMILKGRTLVPMRAIFEAMGADVSWIQETQTVVGVGKDQTMVVLPIGAEEATVNDKKVALDVPAQIINDRTLAPLRFVGESLGASVSWDASSRRIDITQSLPMEPPAVPQVPVQPEPPVISPAEPPVQVKPVYPDGSVISPVEPPGAVQPVKPAVPPVDINRSYLHVGVEKNEIGLSIKLSSMNPLNPQSSKEGNVLSVQFDGMYMKDPVHLTQPVGGGDLKVDAENTSSGVVLHVIMPENLECQFVVDDGGREMSLVIENRIRNIGRKVYGENDEMITIDTVVPVQYQYAVEGRQMTVILSNTTMGIAEDQYSYYGSVMDMMTVTQVKGEKGPEVHLVLQANQDCKFNTLLTAEGVLNIAVTGRTGEDFSPRGDGIVMIDPGHGGRETGAIYGNVDEREINLDVSLKLGEYLKSKGIEVVYTRTDDRFVGLQERADMANMDRVSLFVSIHCNAAESTSANGTETYFYAPISKPVLFAQRMERQQLAECIQRNAVFSAGLADRGVKEKNLAVLRETKMPAVLVECGFMSNQRELAVLLDPGFQQRIAEGIGNGIIEYLGKNLQNLTIKP